MPTKIFITVILFYSLAVSAKYYTGLSSTDFLSFKETQSLLTKINPDANAVDKLGILLNTVFPSYQSKKFSMGLQLDKAEQKPFLRVTQWNLESVSSEDLKTKFSDFDVYEKSVLKTTDIFTLNNVGYYNEKSNFQNMAEIFADNIGANYVFAPEFLEASPEILSNKKLFKEFKALNGNAIVTRFPVLSAKIIRLPACYDWFYEEQQRMLYDAKNKRMKVKNRVGEGKLDLIRRGGRIALIADLELPNQDVITVVSSQLENRTNSKCRQRQLESILHYMKDFTNPIVFGVDLNNIGKSAAPTTISRTIEKTAKDPKFYVKKAISSINPFSWISSVTSMTYGNLRKMNDPTVRNIPVLLPNNAYKLFKSIHQFEFGDGLKFDFSGEHDLANSNERNHRSYVKTYEYDRWFGKGKVKLDWIFIKPIQDMNGQYYTPQAAETLTSVRLNQSEEVLSMHYPISLKVMI